MKNSSYPVAIWWAMSISLRWYLEYNQENTSADEKNRKPFRIFYGAHPIFHKVLYFSRMWSRTSHPVFLCNFFIFNDFVSNFVVRKTQSSHLYEIFHEVFCTLSVSEERENVTFSRCDPQSSFGLIFKRVLLFLFSKWLQTILLTNRAFSACSCDNNISVMSILSGTTTTTHCLLCKWWKVVTISN